MVEARGAPVAAGTYQHGFYIEQDGAVLVEQHDPQFSANAMGARDSADLHPKRIVRGAIDIVRDGFGGRATVLVYWVVRMFHAHHHVVGKSIAAIAAPAGERFALANWRELF